MGSTDREIGELRADMRHVLDALSEMKKTHLQAVNGVNERLDGVDAKLNTLFANRSLAIGALAVSASVGAFIMWIVKTIAAPVLERMG